MNKIIEEVIFLKKLVDIQLLQRLEKELFIIKVASDGILSEKIDNLYNFVVNEILKTNQMQVNELKRFVYDKMKTTQGEENKKWFDFYQTLK